MNSETLSVHHPARGLAPRTIAAESPSPASTRGILRRYAASSGLPFFCVDAETGDVLESTDDAAVRYLPSEIVRQLPQVADVTIWEHPSGLLFYAVPLPRRGERKVVGLGYVLSRPGLRPHDLVLAAAEESRGEEDFSRWLRRQTHCPRELLETLLALMVKQADNEKLALGLQDEIDDLGLQIEHTYEEISLLYGLARNLQISRSPDELARVCLQRMHPLLDAEANGIWLDERSGDAKLIVEGNAPFDESGMARLIARFEDRDWSRPLVKNHIRGTLLGADFDGLENFVLVPITEGTHRSGWIVSFNLHGGREFGTVQANLLDSVATILGTHIRNIDLYQQHQELLLSFVRSLVSTLDAKDPYTRGHSERVALIARRLAEHLELPADDLHDIYICGLLHDIGKIGVDDRILRKPGRLTDEEFRKIQEHPVIGFNILQGLQNLRNVLPGVRNHHESYNGTGYPDRMKGTEIPLIARILAVADSYDAMGSDRPYRKGMDRETIETIFRRGAGEQWDARVIDAYFAVGDEIEVICAQYSLESENRLDDAFSSVSG